ncbi:MAG TPA: type II toxin-antitoxin system HicA family toxin [Isosphaeraceae bacterium]|nr:type II toxin-antitoxin system HicA family toxin [Isosphaeraceae bacterium]
MGKKHDRTLAAIFARPTRANLAWEDVLSLVVHLGGAVHVDRGGSMREFVLNGVRAIFHEPHPRHEVPQAMIRRLRNFLDEAGIEHP